MFKRVVLFWVCAALLVLSAVACNLAPGSKGVRQKQTEKAWKLVWSDEFDGANGTAIDGSKWKSETGNNSGWGNAELEYYTDSVNNCYQDNGNLIIKAIKEKKEGFDYTSARIVTQENFDFKYGKIEMKAKLPQGNGIWPAFWMLGSNFDTEGWPKCGEVDIMEHIGKMSQKIHGTLHATGYSGSYGITGSIKSKSSLYDSYHTYSLEWNEEGFKWYFDGKKYHEVYKKNIKSGIWPFDSEFFILLNLAVGGYWPGYPDETTQFPQTYTIDYIRVYQQ